VNVKVADVVKANHIDPTMVEGDALMGRWVDVLSRMNNSCVEVGVDEPAIFDSL